MNYTTFVGIDISAQEAHVSILMADGGFRAPHVISQTPEGMEELNSTLNAITAGPSHILIVMEATGPYWMKLAMFLHQAGFAVSVINPAQAHYFAKALLQRSKTDPVDAHVLAYLAAKLQPKPWAPAPEVYELLYQRLSQRDTLLAMLQQERNRLHALRQRPQVVHEVEARLSAHIAFLQTQLKDIDHELQEALAQDHAWADTAALLRTIPGFGPIATAWLLTATRGFTACDSPEQIASYAGLVPRFFESGSSISRRPAIGHASHSRLRHALYMASLSAVQHNPTIRAFYRHLLAQGKPKQVALCACARKLVHLAWGVFVRDQPFTLSLVPAAP